MDFNSVLNMKADTIERPPLLPAGTYEWLIYKTPAQDTIESPNGSWDTIDIPLKCIRPTEDVDEDALREFKGDVRGQLQSIRFMFDKNDEHKFGETLFRLKRFLSDTCGINLEGLPLKEALQAAVNKRILAVVVHKPDRNDTEVWHANIGRTAPVE